jgi:serine/threonine-protein kinase
VAQDRVTVARREAAARSGQALRIGKYEILQRIGEGGSGIVYRAHQTTLGREVALKVLSQKREGEEEYLERFNREAQVAVTLNHVNIVRGLDFGNADGYHYFARELVEGESLFSLIRREGRLPEKKAIDVVLQMVRALEHAGKFHIVHRDIKPENILVTRSGTAKLCDLGLARPMIQGGQADSQGRPIGTALYVAPEQIRREGNLDFRADIYSLGATLFHALTGAPPYTGQTVQEIIRAHLSAPVPNPRDRVLEISTGTAAIVVKMLSKDPGERYQSLEALDEDLDSVLEGKPPVNTITLGRKAIPLGEAGPRAPGERRRESKAFVPGLVLASVVVLGAAGWYLFGRSKPPAPPPADPAPLKGPKVDPVMDAARLREVREKAGQDALAEAEEFGRDRGDAPEASERLRAVVRDHPGTEAAARAGRKAAELEKARSTRLAAELSRRKDAFDAAFGEGRLGEALAAWDGLPAEVAAAGGEEAAASSRGRVEEAGKRLLETARTLARRAGGGDAASEGPARRALDLATHCGLPAVAGEAEKERREMEAAVAARAERLRAAEQAWPGACAEALAAAARAPAEGVAVLDAAAAVLAPLGEKVDLLRRAVGESGGFSDAVRRGFQKAAAASESVRLRVPGRPGGSVAGRAVGVRGEGLEVQRGPAVEVLLPKEVEPEDLGTLAWRAMDLGSARDHRGAAAFYLGRGAFALADVEVRALEVLDAAEAGRTRELVDAVRGAARARAEAALKEAEVLRLQKRLPEARAAFEKAVSLCEGHAPSLWRLGAFLLETTRDGAEALRHLEAAAALDPADPEAWFWIAEGRRRGGKVDEALAALEKYVARAPADDPRREAAGKTLADLRAAASAASARQAREEAARLYRKDDFAGAAELWKKVLAYLPEDPEALYFLGKSLLGLDMKIEGYSRLRRFLNAEKKGGARVEDARRVVRDLEQRFGDSPAAARKALEGANLINTNQYAQGIEALNASLDLACLRADTYVERARGLQFAWSAEGKREYLNQAASDLEVALLINEKHGRGWSMLAVTRGNLEDWPGAFEASGRAVQLDPAWPPVWEYRVKACNRMGRFAEGEQAATDGLAKVPMSAMLLLARAESRAGLGKVAEARADADLAATKFELTPAEKSYRAEIQERIRKASEKGAE